MQGTRHRTLCGLPRARVSWVCTNGNFGDNNKRRVQGLMSGFVDQRVVGGK